MGEGEYRDEYGCSLLLPSLYAACQCHGHIMSHKASCVLSLSCSWLAERVSGGKEGVSTSNGRVGWRARSRDQLIPPQWLDGEEQRTNISAKDAAGSMPHRPRPTQAFHIWSTWGCGMQPIIE